MLTASYHCANSMLKDDIFICADCSDHVPALATVESLELDVLVSIAEKLGPSDLRNLSLVNKLFCSVVSQSAIHLQPHRMLTPVHLSVLGRRFSNATSLDIPEDFASLSLQCLPIFFPKLRQGGAEIYVTCLTTYIGHIPLADSVCPHVEKALRTSFTLLALLCRLKYPPCATSIRRPT